MVENEDETEVVAWASRWDGSRCAGWTRRASHRRNRLDRTSSISIGSSRCTASSGEQAGGGLKPVTSHGAVSVWTAPAGFLKSLPAGTVAEVISAPKLIAAPTMTPAHVTTRKNQSFVTQAAWIDEAKDLRIKYDSVRSGMAATVAGRKLDQGILVQLVIEDTDIRSIHTVNVTSPVAARHSASRQADEPANCVAQGIPRSRSSMRVCLLGSRLDDSGRTREVLVIPRARPRDTPGPADTETQKHRSSRKCFDLLAHDAVHADECQRQRRPPSRPLRIGESRGPRPGRPRSRFPRSAARPWRASG